MEIPILIHYLKEYKKRKFLAQGRYVYPFESYLGSKLEKGQFKKIVPPIWKILKKHSKYEKFRLFTFFS